jgi:hypothetical protein
MPAGDLDIMADEPGAPARLPYVYKALPPGNVTRIIELEPSEDTSAPLRCRLRDIDLDGELERYEALSYTWGNPDYSKSLTVDDTFAMKITANLSSALHKFRLRYKARKIWADAICINQGDNDEKTRQIPRMATIYRGANRVIVWLGDWPVEAALIDRLQVLARQITAMPLDPWNQDVSDEVDDSDAPDAPGESVSNNPGTDVADQEGSISALQEATAALEQVVHLPWFSRRWIIQEVVLNSDVSLFCHTSSISWVRFISILEDIARLDSGVPKVISTFRKLFDLWLTFLRSGFDGGNTLGELLEAFEDYGCADSRDRIFALLIIQMGEHTVQADYSLSTQEVYTKFAEEALRDGRLLWVLTQAAVRNTGSGGDLPLCVPDWSKPRVRRPFWDNHHNTLSLDSPVERLEDGKGLRISTFLHRIKLASAASAETEHDAHTAENTKINHGDWGGPVQVRVTWRSSTFPDSHDSDQGGAQVKAWFVETLRALYNCRIQSQSRISTPEIRYRALYEFIGIVLTSTNMTDVSRRLLSCDLRIESWWSPQHLVNIMQIPAMTKGLGQHIIEEDSGCTAEDEADTISDPSSSDGYSTSTSEGAEPEFSSLMDDFIELLRTVLPGRCVFTCAVDSKVGGAPPTEVIGVGSSLLETGDGIISICSKASRSRYDKVDDPEYLFDCNGSSCSAREGMFIVRDAKVDTVLSEAVSKEKESTPFQFIGDCVLSTIKWKSNTRRIQRAVPLFRGGAQPYRIDLS